jgi:hypothetical protein
VKSINPEIEQPHMSYVAGVLAYWTFCKLGLILLRKISIWNVIKKVLWLNENAGYLGGQFGKGAKQ